MLAQGSGNDQHNGIVGLYYINSGSQILETERATKQQVRQAMKTRLEAMTLSEFDSANALIRQKFLQLDIVCAANKIMLYYSVKSEVETVSLIEELLQKGKSVALPRCIEGRNLRASFIHQLDELSPGFFGLYEPSRGEPSIEPGELDLIVLPGLAFDHCGNRLGHGAGYYDRFLAGVKHPYKLGLAYDFQLVSQLPVEPFDIAVNGVLTPVNYYKTGIPTVK